MHVGQIVTDLEALMAGVMIRLKVAPQLVVVVKM
jgi:hypothetical protein